jgi:hypothetical protein
LELKEERMNRRIVDVLTRGSTGAVSRRASLLTMGGATLSAAMAASMGAAAGRSGKRGKNRCKPQKGKCLAYFAGYCLQQGEPSLCEDKHFPCCEYFARCNAAAGFACLFPVK